MKFDVYFVDAFTDEVFAGNPAAVIFTDIDDDRLMQKLHLKIIYLKQLSLIYQKIKIH